MLSYNFDNGNLVMSYTRDSLPEWFDNITGFVNFKNYEKIHYKRIILYL